MGKPASLIKPVADRPGHDRRYAVDAAKLRGLGWTPQIPFEQGLSETVAWCATTSGGGGRSKGATPLTRHTTPRSTSAARRKDDDRSDSGDRRGRVRRQPPARRAREAPDAGRRLASPRRGPSGSRRGVRWVSIEMLDRAVGRRCPIFGRQRSTILPARRRTSRSRGTTRSRPTRATSGDSHQSVRGSACREAAAARLRGGSATIYRPQERPIHEEDSLAPASPYATSKLVQEMLARRAAAHRRPADAHRTLVQPCRSAPGPIVRRLEHCPTRSR